MSTINYPSRISLTGPDDNTDIVQLNALASLFPAVEWALLYVPHNEGAPRNPTAAWRRRFFNEKVGGLSAVHLCGSLAFEQLLEGTLPWEVLKADRLQLNINARRIEFDERSVLSVFERAIDLGPDLILQFQPDTAGPIKRFLNGLSSAARSRIGVLLDESRGTGKAPSHWGIPVGLSCDWLGFAGGINPMNVTSVCSSVSSLGVNYWIDMESGVRTDNRFDTEKCRRVLEASHEPSKLGGDAISVR